MNVKPISRMVSAFLVICLLCTMLPISAMAEENNTGHLIWDNGIALNYADGDGSENNPFQIATPQQLAKLANDSAKNFYYVLNNDIYLNDTSDANWNDEADVNYWTPISSFDGTFDGKGYSIYGLYSGSLFGYATGTIQNICIKESYVFSGYQTYVGAVAGYANSISGCSNSGSVSAYNASNSTVYAGGIAGYAKTVSQCSNSGSVWAGGGYNAAAGGIVGCSGNNVTNCYNTGYVSASSDFASSGYSYNGGIVGSTEYNGTKIDCCYDVGMYVSSSSYYSGGIIGLTINKSAPSLTSCYCSASRLVGRSANSSTYGSYTSSSSSVLDEDELMQVNSYAGFDFDSIWTFVNDTNEGYPVLCWENGIDLDSPVPSTPSSDVIEFCDEPYSLSVGDELSTYAVIYGGGNLTSDDITVTSSNESVFQIVSVNTGVVSENDINVFIAIKGVSDGTASLTISTSDGRSASSEVSVGSGGTDYEFDPEIYRADRLLDTSNVETETMMDILSGDTPCELYVPLLQENGFETWSSTWTALTTMFDALDSPSTLYDFAVEEKDIYSAIILNLLKVSTDYGIVDAWNAVIKDAKADVSEVNLILKTDYDIIISNSGDWKSLSVDEQKKVKEACEKFYKEKYEPDVASLNKVFSNFGKALDIADCLETYLERVASAYALVEMSDSLKTVLETMYQKCPASNSNLKLALFDCVEIINSSADGLLAKLMSDAFSVVGVEIAQYLVDELWNGVKEALNFGFPCLEVLLAGYKTGKFISNTLFSTDDTVEQYCVMLATIDVENLMADVFDYLAEQHSAASTRESASAYLSAIDVLFASRDGDCSAAYNFVDVLDDAIANQIGALFDQTGANQRDGIKKSVKSIQTTYNNVHSSVLTSWIYYLEEDYPDSGLYEYYYALYLAGEDLTVTKKYVAACPVDVYVYDAEDNLVAYVIDNKPYCSGNLTVAVAGDTKELYFYDDAEYRIEYAGNDTGTMDLAVTEYDSDGAEERSVYFYDVALTDGSTYTVDDDGGAYSLNTTSGDEVNPDLDTNSAAAQKYTVSVNSGSMMIGDELLFETEAYADESITIYAYVPDGYTFKGWTSDLGTDIFEDATARITTLRVPASDVTITAVSVSESGYTADFTTGVKGDWDTLTELYGRVSDLKDLLGSNMPENLETYLNNQLSPEGTGVAGVLMKVVMRNAASIAEDYGVDTEALREKLAGSEYFGEILKLTSADGEKLITLIQDAAGSL